MAELEPPARSASTKAWQEYAAAVGYPDPEQNRESLLEAFDAGQLHAPTADAPDIAAVKAVAAAEQAQADVRAAAETGATLVRLVPAKWSTNQVQFRDEHGNDVTITRPSGGLPGTVVPDDEADTLIAAAAAAGVAVVKENI